MARVLIAGCGDVGGALAERLLAAGEQVWGLRRSVDRLPAGVLPLAADLRDAQGWPELPRDLDAVVFAAAAENSSEESYRRLYVDGLGHLIRALVAAGQSPRRLLFTSSTGVYGQDAGEWVDESSRTEPAGFRGRLMLAAEKVAICAPFPATVVRFGGIYGPGRTRLIDRVRAGTTCQVEPPLYTNRVHLEDCAAILEHLLRAPDPAAIYLGVDHDPAAQHEVLAWLAAELGVKPPAAETAAETATAGAGKRCSNRRLLESGYPFLYPTFREGYGAILAGGR